MSDTKPATIPGPRQTKSMPWPGPDKHLISSLVGSGPAVAQLKGASPVDLADDRYRTEEVIDSLFPGNPLLYVGFTKFNGATNRRESFRGRLQHYPYLLPSPMAKRLGTNGKGGKSKRCNDAVGPRRFLVLDFDPEKWETLTLDEQAVFGSHEKYYAAQKDSHAALLRHLADYGPLALVVDSGAKSLHGWFYCERTDEGQLLRFMRYAVSLGADRMMWIPAQHARMPDGTREGGARQRVVFLNPAATLGETTSGFRGGWAQLEEIPLPKGKEDGESGDCSQETQETQRHREEGKVFKRRVPRVDVNSVEGIVEAALPTQPHDTYLCLFTLARGVRALEKRSGSSFSLERLREVFAGWHALALPNLDGTRTEDEYFAEFVGKLEVVRYPLGEAGIHQLWQEVQSEPLPPMPEGLRVFKQRELLLLVALCRKLQLLHGDEPFFLSPRMVAKLMGHTHPTTAQYWLQSLRSQRVGVLREVTKGKLEGRQASTYRYLPPLNAAAPEGSGEAA